MYKPRTHLKSMHVILVALLQAYRIGRLNDLTVSFYRNNHCSICLDIPYAKQYGHLQISFNLWCHYGLRLPKLIIGITGTPLPLPNTQSI